MLKSLILMMSVVTLALLATGCAGPEKKLGRGMANLGEIVRWGECRRSVEQTAVFYSPEEGYTRGFISGLNRTLARTGLGVYEIVTFPIPSYEPVWTNYLAPNPVYPDSYRPNLAADQNFATDTSLGYSGGDVLPIVPGSRFHIYEQVH
ncbi:MAG: exosortase system-associated protein, TIGR04073 family [Verrucomicrobia bacterium]|jgi:putative exosortase-associated protein (TIGR04073 family)|nr:exosortase system-associated protein, TIGR04073 family [Verrucomicrobiota bacterium]